MFRRLRGAWQVLMGRELVPFQIQAEWVLYQQTFQSQLEQMSSYLARQAKSEKKRLERLHTSLKDDPAPPPPEDHDARKRAVRIKARGLQAAVGKAPNMHLHSQEEAQ